MRRPATLPAFSEGERKKAHALLGSLVASMMGRKLEEGDWAEVYCTAKGIPLRGWSNLDIDVMHENLGVEHKMKRYKSDRDLTDACGETLMHPSATRSIRVPPTNTDPDAAMVDVLTQYAELIEARRQKVWEQAPGDEPDMRTGWLLWQDSLRQFLYFEEEMLPPYPADYFAEWRSRRGGGSRKPSTSLWIYEKDTGKKRYSVTGPEAGAKIQPYFDVPPPNDPNLYLFTVIGEVVDVGLIRVWITEATARELERLLGGLDVETVSQGISEAAAAISEIEEPAYIAGAESAREILVTEAAYDAVRNTVPGVSDEHSFQLLSQYLRSQNVQ